MNDGNTARWAPLNEDTSINRTVANIMGQQQELPTAVNGAATVVGRVAVDPGEVEAPMAYLIFNAVGEFVRAEYNLTRAEAVCDDRQGVMMAGPILRDSRTRVLPEAEKARKAALARAALGEPISLVT